VLADIRAGEVIHRLHSLFKRGETVPPARHEYLVSEVLDISGDLMTRRSR
jgi:hypothetical protein